MLLSGGLDWKPMSLSPADMDFVEQRNVAAREIALAFGVPPMLLGIPGDATYANYREANSAFWRLTVLPLVNKAARAISCWLGARMGGGIVRGSEWRAGVPGGQGEPVGADRCGVVSDGGGEAAAGGRVAIVELWREGAGGG